MYLCESNDIIFLNLFIFFVVFRYSLYTCGKSYNSNFNNAVLTERLLNISNFFEFNIYDKFKLKFEKTGLDQACFSSGDRYSDKCYFKYILLSSNSRKYALFWKNKTNNNFSNQIITYHSQKQFIFITNCCCGYCEHSNCTQLPFKVFVVQQQMQVAKLFNCWVQCCVVLCTVV